MAKHESPIAEYPGHVILPDFLNVYQVRSFEDAYFGDPNKVVKDGERAYISVSDEKMLPVLIEIVKEWHIENIPEKPGVEEIPMTPAEKGHEFVKWLSGELYKMYTGEAQVPNE